MVRSRQKMERLRPALVAMWRGRSLLDDELDGLMSRAKLVR